MLVAPPIPENEDARLAALADYQLLDTAPEDVFDAFARAAAGVCGVPIGLISLIDRDRQFFKANIGLGTLTETPRNASFCAFTIVQDGVLEVPDAATDPRFRANPLVTGDERIRFYAGIPLVAAGGEARTDPRPADGAAGDRRCGPRCARVAPLDATALR
jgi:GAF domain-containing protein